MFAHAATSDPLMQGDLIDDCPLVSFNLTSGPIDWNDPPTKWWPARVIILTQACDLARGNDGPVLVAVVHDAKKIVADGVLKASAIRDQVRRHLVFGWYFLPAVTTPFALPESVIDLREIHSVPRVVLEQLVSGVKRVASLVSPYREHLAQHFAVTYMRIALPEPYPTQP